MREPGDVADLGDDHRGQHRADARQGLDRLVAVVAGQQVGDDRLQHGDLGGQLTGELRSEATFPAYGCGSARPSSQVFPHTPKMSVQVTGMPSLASTAWTWSLQLVRSRTSLMPVAGQLPQLADLGRGDPRLRQPAHPQQVGQVRGVPLIVLDPAVG